MVQTYTYDDFLKALEQSGFGGQFSQADLNLARQNPDAGMSLLSYKTDYANAATDELRALANQGAESVRSSWGGYTGGGDGGSFKLDPVSPRSYSYGDAPTFDDRWEGRITDALDAQMRREPYSYAGTAPEYTNRYDPQIQGIIGDILGRGEFSYDPKTDPVYSAYQKQYAREGQRATANAMGEAAAMTGGMPSSWAMTAASQAGDYYAAQMADKIPELYEDAYNRYLQEYQMKLSDLNALRGLESDDYTKYRDQLSQFNTDRQFDYATWLDNIKLGQQDIDTLRALRADDMALYETQLGQYNKDRDFGYGQLLDEISAQRTRREDERNWAASTAEFGDFSRMAALGVDTSTAERRAALAEAMQAAEIGDYGPLAALGIDTSNAALMQQLDQAYRQAQISSVYASMPTDEERALDLAYRQAQIANIYAGMPTDEERALDLAYRQAQLENLQKGGSGTSSGSGSGQAGPSASNLVTIAEMALKAGDMDTYNQAMSMLGMSADIGAVEDKKTADAAKKNAKATLTGIDDLQTKLDYLKEQKDAGNPEVQTRSQMEALVRSLPGYKIKTMDPVLKKFLDEIYIITPVKPGTKTVVKNAKMTILAD